MKTREAAEDKSGAPTSKPALARAELLDKATRTRLESELDAAVKRRPANERRLAGVLRALAPLSPSLRAAMADATETFLRRGTLDRDLYGACLRSLGETRDKSVTALLKRALVLESAGGLAALSAASFSTDPALGPLLAKVAGGHKAHLAFAAETARVARGEANGHHLASLAPMIKESHRLTLCAEIFVPLARAVDLDSASRLAHVLLPPQRLSNAGQLRSRSGAQVTVPHAGPALTVLRGAERHLGRWLVLAEVAAGSGDPTPLEEAVSRSTSGPSTARSAWSLVAWALADRTAGQAGQASLRKAREPSRADESLARLPPAPRPTVEIVSRLSDRPSADRDTTFLFRMARARMPSARPMLEGLARELPLVSEVSVRASAFLARDYGRKDLAAALLETASSERKEDLRGVATAALYDLDDAEMASEARRLAGDLLGSRSLVNVAWGVLVRAASARGAGGGAGGGAVEAAAGLRDGRDAPAGEGVATETAFRWIQRGWLE